MSGFSCGVYVYKMKKGTPQLSLRCSSGGDKRDRTADLLNAIQALSQLSYTPVSKSIIANYGVNVKMFFLVLEKNISHDICAIDAATHRRCAVSALPVQDAPFLSADCSTATLRNP